MVVVALGYLQVRPRSDLKGDLIIIVNRACINCNFLIIFIAGPLSRTGIFKRY